MSHSHQRKAAALAASFVITSLSISSCAKTPEIAANPLPPNTKNCHADAPNKDVHCHEAEKPKPPVVTANPPPPKPPVPVIIANPPRPAPK